MKALPENCVEMKKQEEKDVQSMKVKKANDMEKTA